MTSVAKIRASVVAALLEQVAKRTDQSSSLLKRHGFTREMLKDPYAMVPLARYIAFFEDTSALLGDPAVGAKLGAALRPADIGPIGVLFMLSESMAQGFRRLSKYVNAVQSGTSSALYETDGEMVWSYRITDTNIWPRRQDSEYTLATCCRLIRAGFSARWKPLEIHFEHGETADLAALQHVFRAPIRFNESGNRIIMDVGESNESHRLEDGDLTLMLERHVGEVISKDAAPSDFKDQVLWLIDTYLGQRRVNLKWLSSQLGLSPRTLQRRLAEDNLTLRALLRRHREAVATLHLTKDRTGLAQLAHKLGYADSTAFWRAYKSWTGETPSNTRRHCRTDR